MTLKRGLAIAHLVLALLYLVFVVFGKWAKGDPDEGVLSADGGTGFGIVAIALGVVLVLLAIMRLIERDRVLPGLGVEQLTIALGLAAVANLLGFVVGWLAVFPADGTGWAIPFAYFPASFIPQIGFLTLSAKEPERGIKPLQPGSARVMSVVALIGGVGVVLFPFLTWISSGSVSLTGYDGRAGNPTSGPRLTYILLIVGAIVIMGAFMRLRPKGLAEPGANLLHSQCLFAGGLVAFLLPLATLISVFQQDLSPTLDPGIGIWMGLLAGAVLLGASFYETRKRGAAGV